MNVAELKAVTIAEEAFDLMDWLEGCKSGGDGSERIINDIKGHTEKDGSITVEVEWQSAESSPHEDTFNINFDDKTIKFNSSSEDIFNVADWEEYQCYAAKFYHKHQLTHNENWKKADLIAGAISAGNYDSVVEIVTEKDKLDVYVSYPSPVKVNGDGQLVVKTGEDPMGRAYTEVINPEDVYCVVNTRTYEKVYAHPDERLLMECRGRQVVKGDGFVRIAYGRDQNTDNGQTR